jgi:hypothetical protein
VVSRSDILGDLFIYLLAVARASEIKPLWPRNFLLAPINDSKDTHRQQASFIHASPGFPLSLMAMLSQLRPPFGIPLSLSHWFQTCWAPVVSCLDLAEASYSSLKHAPREAFDRRRDGEDRLSEKANVARVGGE